MSTSLSTEPVATGIPGTDLANAVRALGVTHVICVPDTMQKSAIDSLAESAPPELLYACTEDEAIGINAGLYITGHQPMMLIQNNGLYACINTIKAIALDAQVPTFMLIGSYGRDPLLTPDASPRRAVNRLEPTLQAWNVPFERIEGPADLPKLRVMWDRSRSTKGPAAAIVGAATL